MWVALCGATLSAQTWLEVQHLPSPWLDGGSLWGCAPSPSGTSTLWCPSPGLSHSSELCNPLSFPWHTQLCMDVCKILILDPAAASTESSSEEPCKELSAMAATAANIQAAIVIKSRAPRMHLSPASAVLWCFGCSCLHEGARGEPLIPWGDAAQG